MTYDILPVLVRGRTIRVATLSRPGARSPVVFLHGFGSSKEDFADAAYLPAFDGRGILAFDAPGCGATECPEVSEISIPFLREVAGEVIDRLGASPFHLVGHSMGGLTGLLLAAERPGSVLSFTNIEGNLAPEDCFLSRQVMTHPAETPQAFLDAFVERVRRMPAWSNAIYARALPHTVRPAAAIPIFRSMVDLSDRGDLLRRFLSLPFRRMFMYGEQNRFLSYLRELRDGGVRLAEVPFSGHFPMYSNPPAMWTAISDFIQACDAD